MQYDSTGKLDLTQIYNRDSPVEYFAALSSLDYCIPQNAKPFLRQLVEARRKLSGRQSVKLIDIGCSYGVNAALLKYGLSFEDLVAHYGELGGRSRNNLIREDEIFYACPADEDLEIVGLDTAHRALRYATEAGILDQSVSLNLEAADAPPTLRDDALADADLIISTGCFGYITTRTLDRLLDCSRAAAPWMCHTVLRMFDFTDAAAMLAERGYVTEEIEGLIPQRRFASDEEQDHVLARLARAGINSIGYETHGWYYATMFVSRPVGDTLNLPLEIVLASATNRIAQPERPPSIRN